MPESLWDQSLRDALAATASASATPGGGSIAPLTAAFGHALVLMALEVTAAKKPSAELAAALDTGRALLRELAEHPDRDIAVFGEYMQAVGLPRQTDAEKAARDTARHAAAAKAASEPLMAADACLRALGFAASQREAVQKNVVSDLLAGADILFGSVRAVLRTVAINLPALGDEALRRSLEERMGQLEAEAAKVYASIVRAA